MVGFLSNFHDTDKDPAYDVFAAWKLAITNPLIEDLFEGEETDVEQEDDD